MYMSLLAGGGFAIAAGIAMLGFGISNNEFGLGNTLLITGTTAVVGGLILIGLAAAVKQLRRIAEALVPRPASRSARPLDPFDPLTPGNSRPGAGPGRIPFPPKPNSEGRGRGPAPFEPRLAAAPSIDASSDASFDRPRSMFPMISDPPEPREDEAPISPRRMGSEPRFGMVDVAVQVRSTDIAGEAGLAAVKEVLPVSQLDVALRPAAPETMGQNELFDSLWPADAKPRAPVPGVEPQMSKPAPESQDEGQGEEQKPAEASAEPHAVSILKSGVIDGMAYTLYSDGSIEAELPQGMMRFGSITELRGYLEKST
jgi:hypothetical protein